MSGHYDRVIPRQTQHSPIIHVTLPLHCVWTALLMLKLTQPAASLCQCLLWRLLTNLQRQYDNQPWHTAVSDAVWVYMSVYLFYHVSYKTNVWITRQTESDLCWTTLSSNHYNESMTGINHIRWRAWQQASTRRSFIVGINCQLNLWVFPL